MGSDVELTYEEMLSNEVELRDIDIERLKRDLAALREAAAALISKLPACHVCKKPGTHLSHYHFDWFYACDEHYEGDMDTEADGIEDVRERDYAAPLRALQALLEKRDE